MKRERERWTRGSAISHLCWEWGLLGELSGGEEAPQLTAALLEAGASVFTIARNVSQLEDILKKTGGVIEDGIVANLATRGGVEVAMKAFKNRILDIL